jgi:tripartite-type tricarboxylate transporter receptor subunit TctC
VAFRRPNIIARRTFLSSALLTFSQCGQAQTTSSPWPIKPVKILVGFPPGQGSDIVARVYAAELQKILGQTFVVENKPGAGATIAVAEVARAPSDGYTIALTSSGPLTVAPHLYPNLAFDAMKDLEPIALVGLSPLVLVVRADFPANTLADLLKLASQRDLTCGSGGNGVTNHLALEMLNVKSGVNLRHVPYKGSVPALADLIGGVIDVLFDTTSTTLPHLRSGRLRALAVTSHTRYSELPQIPTVAEVFPGFEAVTWAMFVAPRGTPLELRELLAAQLVKIMRQPEIKLKLQQNGVEATPETSPQLAKAYALAEFEKWARIIKQANVKI